MRLTDKEEWLEARRQFFQADADHELTDDELFEGFLKYYQRGFIDFQVIGDVVEISEENAQIYYITREFAQELQLI